MPRRLLASFGWDAQAVPGQGDRAADGRPRRPLLSGDVVRIVKKTLKGDLMGRTGFKTVSSKRKAGTPGEAPPVRDPAQRVLDEIVDDDITVITEAVPVRHGKAIVLNTDHQEVPPVGTKVPTGTDANLAGAPAIKPAPAPVPPKAPRKLAGANQPSPAPASPHPSAPRGLVLDGGSIPLARSVLSEALFRDCGAPGTKVQQPKGSHFAVHPKHGAGVVRTQHNLMLPLPEGHATSHAADLVIELENGAMLMLDIVPSSIAPADMKALAFDALQLRRLDLAFSVLVFVRSPGSGMAQEQAQAIGHGYDVHFGVSEENLHSEQAFAALRSRIVQWLKAAASK